MIKKLFPALFLFTGFLILSLNRQSGLQQVDQPGEVLYKQYCLTCHQPDGNGVRGMYPPLAGNVTVSGPADSVIKIVLSGLQGPIEVNGREYNQVMPPQDYLTDNQIADILSFIRNSWGNKAAAITPEPVAKMRKALKSAK